MAIHQNYLLFFVQSICRQFNCCSFRNILLIYIAFFAVYSLPASASDDQQWVKQGQTAFQNHQFPAAIQHWEMALKENLLKPNEKLDILIHLALAYQKVGNYSLTFTTLQQALTLAKNDIGSIGQQVMLHSYLGDVLLAMQRPQAAQKQLEEALALADHSTSPELMIQTLNNLGNVLTLQATHSLAIEKFTQAIEIAENSNKPTLKIQVLTNLAKTYFKQDNIQASLNELHTASALLQQSSNSGQKLEQLLAAGKLALRLLRHPLYPQFQSQFSLEKITSYLLTQANQLAEKYANQQLIAYAKGYLGELYEINQQLAAALVSYREAIFYSQGDAEISYYWEWRLGRIFQQQQQLLAAETAYKQALNTLRPVRTRMMTGQRDYMDMFYQRILIATSAAHSGTFGENTLFKSGKKCFGTTKSG